MATSHEEINVLSVDPSLRHCLLTQETSFSAILELSATGYKEYLEWASKKGWYFDKKANWRGLFGRAGRMHQRKRGTGCAGSEFV